MRIDSQSSTGSTLQQVRREQDRNIQSVFSEVLREAGREGYASAQKSNGATAEAGSPAVEPLSGQIEASWNTWYQTERLGRYKSPEAPRDLGETFGNVLQQAYAEGAYVEPKSFLSGLSEQELTTVQSAHWLADPIDVNSLTEEGALNLLLPPAAQVDLNHDGLTQSGRAYGIRFPDSNTPPEVTAAWDEATGDMPPQERMMFELRMKLPVLFANIVTDAEGSVVHVREPGDADFVNPLSAENYSYLQVTRDWMEHLEYFKAQIDPQRYAKDMEFWQNFQQSLRNHGAQ